MRTRPGSLKATAFDVGSDLNRVQLQLAVAAFQRGKVQEAALISKLAVTVGLYYLALIAADVQIQVLFLTHTYMHTWIDSNLKVW